MECEVVKGLAFLFCKFRPVTEYNEIANHFADCIYVHCYSTRLRLQENTSTSVNVPNLGFNTPVKGYQPSLSNQFSRQFAVDRLEGVEKLILDYLQQPALL
ncbi:unnamed protein product [Coffea canephora]|uniref:Uncharacterized protein n=1 Tax=Coffea canephora TaxID=49390 RepID=A0A068V8K2_COFCA|nr:unnamed protein product [Coffea canephora]